LAFSVATTAASRGAVSCLVTASWWTLSVTASSSVNRVPVRGFSARTAALNAASVWEYCTAVIDPRRWRADSTDLTVTAGFVGLRPRVASG
jgi:hypothetical protein